ncbi:TetR/AcrR family transcriptional regulator [Alginatibacterium sediminis]|uniref:TetR/AcrR family transcriptional regulator n=1 Tax=Alginatibacterium sediminis TaxID=2164068 RepID=A0A420ED97_9ALTE|nr:TetR/AcrR family transcriptional regulator [Alginatibacterium sediminis]RKF18709.1 TetR/AcrR family transcriptional regulator [Alginatibacterium sediminis]
MSLGKRELKTAQNKQAILKSLLSRMSCEDFDLIKISDLCNDAAVSQASFFNYFPQKTDILIYYIQLWAVEMHWQITRVQKLTGLAAIEQLFADTAEICAAQPQLMAEIVSFQAKPHKSISASSLGAADKLVAYPDCEGISDINVEDLKALLSLYIQQAIEQSELPKACEVDNLLVSLCGIFFAVPTLFNLRPLNEIKAAYHQQFSLFKYGAAGKYV